MGSASGFLMRGTARDFREIKGKSVCSTQHEFAEFKEKLPPWVPRTLRKSSLGTLDVAKPVLSKHPETRHSHSHDQIAVHAGTSFVPQWPDELTGGERSPTRFPHVHEHHSGGGASFQAV